MQKLLIALIGIIIILAFIGGYFMGVLNSSGNLTLNVSNKSNNSGSTGLQTTQNTQTAQKKVSNTIKKVSNKSVTPTILKNNNTTTQ
jgi:hypothetical protein